MYSFKIGDKVKGFIARFNDKLDDYERFPYSGTVSHDFEDGSYTVTTEDQKVVLVELYWELESMEYLS